MPTLTWIGKDKVVTHHKDVPYRVLTHKYGFNRDNSDSKLKIELGSYWQNIAGDQYRYYMVFDKQEVEGALTKDKFLERLKSL